MLLRVCGLNSGWFPVTEFCEYCNEHCGSTWIPPFHELLSILCAFYDFYGSVSSYLKHLLLSCKQRGVIQTQGCPERVRPQANIYFSYPLARADRQGKCKATTQSLVGKMAAGRTRLQHDKSLPNYMCCHR